VAVVFGGEVIAETPGADRVLETSHRPRYDSPKCDRRAGGLMPSTGAGVCEWKGHARYYGVHAGATIARRAAWGYPNATPRLAAIADCVSIYPRMTDRGVVDTIAIVPHEGGFYGGCATPEIFGPVKGETRAWGW
jgi:uncharacterized protein (DUF427 family)